MRTALLGLVMVAAGCMTPYQRRGFAGGYDEQQLPTGEWLVSVSGNGFTSMPTIYSYMHRRAAEICPGGYDLLDGTGESRTSTLVGYQNGSLWGSSTTKPELVARIRCHGEAASASVLRPPPAQPAPQTMPTNY